jgi:hypothetical protein
MQDNELWRRHLLGLVTQVVVAGYVVSRPSWPDKRLLAAMVLMFLSGSYKYAQRTLCLYGASPAKLKESSLRALRAYGTTIPNTSSIPELVYERIIDDMIKDDVFRTFEQIISSASSLLSETPLRLSDFVSPSCIQRKLNGLKSSADPCKAYDHVSTLLVHIYEQLYTKSRFHVLFINSSPFCTSFCDVCFPLPVYLLILSPLISTSATLVLFVVAKKSQLYSQADVVVSYVLLIGAITLEVASLFVIFTSIRLARCTKQWSGMLGQYNMINSLTKQDDTGIMSFVPQWISQHLDDKTVTHIHMCEDLKKFVLDKLLEFGTRQEGWNFAGLRGQLALGDWESRHGLSSRAGSEMPLHKSISDVDFPTSVLIWHIATDMLYFQDNNTSSANSCQQTIKMGRELSNYVMYLVFKCGVMITNTTELQHNHALEVMEAKRSLGEKRAMNEVFQASKLTNSRMEALIKPLLPHACKLAQELIDIPEDAKSWDLIAAVWLEMLFHIAPRCGGTFHSEHLATGGEFITHVLLLMQLLGPFLRPLSPLLTRA